MEKINNVSSAPLIAVCKCVYGIVARVVYRALFLDWTKPQTGRLNKSPDIVHEKC